MHIHFQVQDTALEQARRLRSLQSSESLSHRPLTHSTSETLTVSAAV